MEGTESVTRTRKPAASTKRALIIEVWESLGRTMVGEPELREIQTSVRKQFGPGADESPAAIARVLAAEGAELRHPEVIELDARWREAKIETESRQLKGLDELLTAKPLQLKKAETLIKKLEKLRQRAETSGDQAALHQVRTLAVSGRQQAELLAKDRKLKCGFRHRFYLQIGWNFVVAHRSFRRSFQTKQCFGPVTLRVWSSAFRRL